MKRLLLLQISLFSLTLSFGQMAPKEFNLTSFRSRTPKISEELLKAVPADFYDHPEFGVLPYNAPCTDCYELIHKRTDSTRLFIAEGTGGTEFYSQAVYGIFHYPKNGRMISIDPLLLSIGGGYYESPNQAAPTFLDINEQLTGFKTDNQLFRFNNNLSLTFVLNDGTLQSLGAADWTNYTVGEEGIRIINAWDGIDIQILYSLDQIKTNYILNQEPANLENVKYLRFSDDILLPVGYSMQTGDTEFFDNEGNRFGNYSIRNAANEEKFTISKAFGYDNSGLKERSASFHYEWSDQTLSLFVPSDWMTADDAVYPLVIDPLVSSVATFSAGWMSFRYNGAWCGAAGSCNYNLTVPRPANSTITGTILDAQYQSLSGYCFFACYMAEGAFKVVSPCGIAPAATGSFWNCNTSAPGTCTGAGIDVFPELGACLGSACSGNVNFQIQNSYCYCSSGGNCGNNCQYMPNNTWSMTLRGSTLETLGNTATGNGTQSIIVASCSGNTILNPAAQNGVPGYSYLWSVGGQTTSTVTVPSISTGPHTVQVTDACGVTRTATFVIVCPLAVEYIYFKAEKINRNVMLQWQTGSEKNNDHFRIERSFDGTNFEAIASIPSKGSDGSTYLYTDYDVQQRENVYYRIVNVDNEKQEEFTDIQVIHFDPDNPDLMLVPNPNGGDFKVVYNVPYTSIFTLEVTSAAGRVILRRELELEKGRVQIPVTLTGAAKGVYTVRLITQNQAFTEKLVIE